MRLHSSTGRVHKWHVCNKAYLTKSKLNEHSKLLITGKPQCEHCDKLLADSKSLADHKKICPKCPGSADLTEEQKRPHKCPNCYKRYMRAADVSCHCKPKHPNAQLHLDGYIWQPDRYILCLDGSLLHPDGYSYSFSVFYLILCFSIASAHLHSLISCHPVVPSLWYHFIPICVFCKCLSLAFASSIVSVSSLIQALSSNLFIVFMVQHV